MKTTAIVPAAGSGKRFGSTLNKAFHLLAGKPIILHVLDILEGMPEIHEIIPVIKKDDMQRALGLIEQNNITKAKIIAPGGRERMESVFHALKLIDDSESVVLIHDGARPLISREIIKASLAELKDNDGVVAAVPIRDTIKEINGDYIKKTLERQKVMAIQTPQVFYLKSIMKAYAAAYENKLLLTDDAAVMERAGGKIKVISGSCINIKITDKNDLEYAEFILSKKGRN